MATKKQRKMSPWVPMTNARHKKAIGKLMEELGEASAITARCFIQGLDGRDPGTGVVNRAALQDELADVHGMIMLVSDVFSLDVPDMIARSKRKLREKMEWLEMDATDG